MRSRHMMSMRMVVSVVIVEMGVSVIRMMGLMSMMRWWET